MNSLYEQQVEDHWEYAPVARQVQGTSLISAFLTREQRACISPRSSSSLNSNNAAASNLAPFFQNRGIALPNQRPPPAGDAGVVDLIDDALAETDEFLSSSLQSSQRTPYRSDGKSGSSESEGETDSSDYICSGAPAFVSLSLREASGRNANTSMTNRQLNARQA